MRLATEVHLIQVALELSDILKAKSKAAIYISTAFRASLQCLSLRLGEANLVSEGGVIENLDVDLALLAIEIEKELVVTEIRVGATPFD